MAVKIDESRFKIQWRDPASLTPHPANFRRHPERQREVLRVALGDEGWTTPLLYNKRTGRILDGHLRAEEAIAQGVKAVPVIEIDVDEATERKILVRHDRIGALAELDLPTLEETLRELEAAGTPLAELAWDNSLAHPPEPTAPTDFREYDENVETRYQCPKCGYKWSGKAGGDGKETGAGGAGNENTDE